MPLYGFCRNLFRFDSIGPVLITACLFTLIIGCDSMTIPYSPEISEAKESLWADPALFWNSKEVPVCWENPTDATAAQMEWVQQAIAYSWSFVGDIEFTGWGTCQATSTGLRIHWQDDTYGPRVIAIGNNLNGLNSGLILDNVFTKFTVSPSTPGYSFVITCTPTSTPAQIEECIKNIAIHEFGHVLGFHHEQNAPGASSESDFPAGCNNLVDTSDIISDGGVLYDNDWDLDSVMNYCNPAYGGPKLSSLDFRGMMYFYGISPRFIAALVGSSII